MVEQVTHNSRGVIDTAFCGHGTSATVQHRLIQQSLQSTILKELQLLGGPGFQLRLYL